MPRLKKSDTPPARTPQLNTRLNKDDYLKLESVCRIEGLTKTELLRKALLAYLDGYDAQAEERSRDRLAEVLERMIDRQDKNTDRLAKMVFRATLDVGILNQVFYGRASREDREDIWAKAKTRALDRLSKKRKGGDEDLKYMTDSDAVSN